MNTTWRAIVAGAAFAALSSSGAFAADMYGGSIKDSYIPTPLVTQAPSWYFRLDGAYGGYDAPVMVEDGITTLTDTSIERGWSLGGGVGRYFSQNIRGDLTYEHRFETTVKGSQPYPWAAVPGTREFGLKSHLFLANLYYDFDNSSRFTPYVGVGLGFVRHNATAGTITSCNCSAAISEASETDVAGALMAGFSVALREKLKFDAGYRFLYLGSATSGPLSATLNNQVVTANDPTVEDIHAHEFRFGLRYDMW